MPRDNSDTNLVKNLNLIPDNIRLVNPDGTSSFFDRNGVRIKIQESGLDLYLVNKDSIPPVYRLLDYGKFKFDQQKRQREIARNGKNQNKSVKDYKFKPSTGEHDIKVKVDAITKHLEEGHDIRIEIDLKKFAFVLTNRWTRRMEDVVKDENFVLNKVVGFLTDVADISKVSVSENTAFIILKRKT